MASSIPLIPSLGNHENYAGPGGGYETVAADFPPTSTSPTSTSPPTEPPIHCYDVGIVGDGLRGPSVGFDNPFRQFLANENCPEVWRAGKPLSGGRYYRHLGVNVHPATNGRSQVDIVPVYAFPEMNDERRVNSWQRRIHDDHVTILSR